MESIDESFVPDDELELEEVRVRVKEENLQIVSIDGKPDFDPSKPSA